MCKHCKPGDRLSHTARYLPTPVAWRVQPSEEAIRAFHEAYDSGRLSGKSPKRAADRGPESEK